MVLQYQAVLRVGLVEPGEAHFRELDRAQRALQQSEARYRSFFENLRENVALYEAVGDGSGHVLDWRIQHSNQAYRDAVGLDAARLHGRSLSEVFGADAVSAYLPDLERVLTTGEPEVREVAYAGRHYLVAGYRMDERTVATAGLDLTDRKHMEEALREAGRRKDEFLALLSHELRNPLAPIRNAVHVLERVETGDAAQRARAVIARQVGHLVRLVDDLLDVTRIGSGKIRLRLERADLRELVRRTAEDHRASMEEGGIAFEVELPGEPLWADLDPTRMAQALGNLLANAAKFTPPGGEVVLAVRASAGAALVTVADTGAGIEADLLGRLFQPFVQGERTLVRSSGGLGLGLALVKGLAELHGGAVSARSDGPGRGAEFVVRLPLRKAAPTALAEVAAAGGRPRLRRRVLVIDDNVDAAVSLAELIACWGHETQVAHDGPSGLASARAGRFDVILCDIGLPGMNGYEVARAVRADATLRGAQLVAVSGYATGEDVTRAVDAGFDSHMAKPADPVEVERLLAQAPPAEARVQTS